MNEVIRKGAKFDDTMREYIKKIEKNIEPNNVKKTGLVLKENRITVKSIIDNMFRAYMEVYPGNILNPQDQIFMDETGIKDSSVKQTELKLCIPQRRVFEIQDNLKRATEEMNKRQDKHDFRPGINVTLDQIAQAIGGMTRE